MTLYIGMSQGNGKANHSHGHAKTGSSDNSSCSRSITTAPSSTR